MDVDVSIIKENNNFIDIYKDADLDAVQRGDFLYLRLNLVDVGANVEKEITQFVEEISSIEKSFFHSKSQLEIAAYYNQSEHVNFSFSFSHEFLEMLSHKNLGLILIGYPCEDE